MATPQNNPQQETEPRSQPQTTEDQILDRLDRSAPDDDDVGTPQAQPSDEQGTAPQQGDGDEHGFAIEDGTAPQQSGGTVQQAQEPAPAQGQQPGQQQVEPQQQQQPELQQHPQYGSYMLDKTGNITDRNGNVIAQAGRERRWFENAATMQSYVERQHQYTQNLENRVRELASGSKEALDGMPERLGLQKDDVHTGLQLAASYKRDPVQTARYILAETMKLGYNLDQITGEPGSNNNVNMSAIRQMIDERVGPIASQHREQTEQERTSRSAEQAYNAFMQQFPDAAPHQDAIAAVSTQYGLSPEQAYFQLRQWATANNLDWNQPLQQQVAQRRAQQQQAPSNGQQPQTRQPAPLPNSGMPQDSVTGTPQVAESDDDYDDIIRTAMREAGMNVR